MSRGLDSLPKEIEAQIVWGMMMSGLQTSASAPKDLEYFALRAAMSLDDMQANRATDSRDVVAFFDKLSQEFGLQQRPTAVRSLIPTHRYLMSRALEKADAGHGADLEGIWTELVRDSSVVSDNREGRDGALDRLMTFCLAVHKELMKQKEQRVLSYRRGR